MVKRKPRNVLTEAQALRASQNIAKLPEWCYVETPGTREPVIVHRGVMGYTPKRKEVGDVWVAEINGLLGVTKEQEMAMLCGSMGGFHQALADPDVWKRNLKWQLEQKMKGNR